MMIVKTQGFKTGLLGLLSSAAVSHAQDLDLSQFAHLHSSGMPGSVSLSPALLQSFSVGNGDSNRRCTVRLDDRDHFVG